MEFYKANKLKIYIKESGVKLEVTVFVDAKEKENLNRYLINYTDVSNAI
jgi:hypothetical protein